MSRSKSTRIIDKFEYWTVEDCACELCVNHIKDQPCPLDVCCVEDIRQEAVRREAEVSATSASTSGEGGGA